MLAQKMRFPKTLTRGETGQIRLPMGCCIWKDYARKNEEINRVKSEKTSYDAALQLPHDVLRAKCDVRTLTEEVYDNDAIIGEDDGNFAPLYALTKLEWTNLVHREIVTINAKDISVIHNVQDGKMYVAFESLI